VDVGVAVFEGVDCEAVLCVVVAWAVANEVQAAEVEVPDVPNNNN
jgi:hypothetical protein